MNSPMSRCRGLPRKPNTTTSERSGLRGKPLQVRYSKLVILFFPVVPIFDGDLSFLIDFERLQLRERNGERAVFPFDKNQHIVLAVGFFGHFGDLDFFAAAERRNRVGQDAARAKRKLKLLFEVAIPAQRALFFVVGIDHDFVVDALFANFVFVLGHNEFWPQV